jgi:hypothetical protein
MATLSRLILPGVLFLLTLAFGFWLSRLGKPYNNMLFNVHKLIALGTVIVLVVQLFKMLQTADSLVMVIALLGVAALCVMALFISGMLMSLGKLAYSLTLTIHRIASGLLMVVMAVVAGLLTV